MESVDLEMNDVFGEEVDDMEDIGAVGALPDLPESTQLEDTEDAGILLIVQSAYGTHGNFFMFPQAEVFLDSKPPDSTIK